MGDYTLQLYKASGENREAALQLPLFPDSLLPRAEQEVFRDFSYRGQILPPVACDNNSFSIAVNGTPLKTGYNPQCGSFAIINEEDEDKPAKPFINCYGYAQLTIGFTVAGVEQRLYSNSLKVLMKYGGHNASIFRMLDYVYRFGEDFLFGGRLFSKSLAGMKESGDKTIESRMLLLHNTARIFEISYPYFKANSRFTTVQAQRVDKFERLQYVSANTINYICCHPEELYKINSPRGIKAGRFVYQPRRTLITNNAPSYDIYENKVIIGFLETMLEAIRGMQGELNSLKQEEGLYIFPDEVNFSGTIILLNTALDDLLKLESRFSALLSEYRAIFAIEGSRVKAAPKPTPVFMAIPQYRQAYDAMLAWFTMGPVTLEERNYLLSFIGLSHLYEVYVLLKLINHFTLNGWSPEENRRLEYALPANSLYENTRCQNMFAFRRDNIRITLYYQPVIYQRQAAVARDFGIGLRRDTGDICSIYTPDYLLKIEKNLDDAGQGGSVKYVFMDAKYSTDYTVKRYEVMDLARKYLFSVSPLSPKEEIMGLLIINGQFIHSRQGQPMDSDKLIDIKATRESFHYADILTLTEESMDNEELHARLLKRALDKYLQ